MKMPSSPENALPLVVLVGPTAVGKTSISLELAERLNAEIVSADARLFYLGMDIGTDKPRQEDRQRVPHHLIDVSKPDETWSVARFQGAARKAIAAIHARGRLPFLVGGTGQYVRSVVEGWVIPPGPPDQRLRAALERWVEAIGSEGLHARLAVLDPEAAEGIDARNVRRTVRALEVILGTGERFSAQRGRQSSEYRTLVLGLTRPRSELYARIDARIKAMVARGFAEEVRGLLAQGYPPDLPAFSAIGYQEMAAHLEGHLTLEEAVAQMKRRTRTFVRRQANWFKAEDPDIHWYQVSPETVETLEAEIQDFLAAGAIGQA